MAIRQPDDRATSPSTVGSNINYRLAHQRMVVEVHGGGGGGGAGGGGGGGGGAGGGGGWGDR